MKVPGYRIGQAANLAHDWLMQGDIVLDEDTFVKLWQSRTRFYIEALNRFEHEFGDDEDWQDQKPEPKPTPVILDFGEGKTKETTYSPTKK